MANTCKRWLSILMSLLLVLSSVPAFADAKCPVCGSADYETVEEWWDGPYCTKEGKVQVGNCLSCGYNEFGDGSAVGHLWDDWMPTNDAPTCTKGGTEIRYCLYCKENEVRQVGPLGHDWARKYTLTEPSCTKDGEEHATCSRCGLTQTFPIKALDHDWNAWKTVKEPTCVDGGQRSRSCNRCKLEQTEAIDALGHDWGKDKVVRESTCVKKGEAQSICSRCKQTGSHDLPYANHKWGEWHVTVAPKPCAKGIEERNCTVCGKAEQRYIFPEGTLFRGDKGNAVKELQQALNDAGYDCGKADGSFGPNTEKAVKEFQEDQGMEADGIGYPCLPDRLDRLINPIEYTGEMTLELLSAPDGFTGAVGDKVELRYKLTNTGDTVLSSNSYLMLDGDGNPVTGVDYEQTGDDMWSWFLPGDSYEITLRVPVTEADMAAGAIVRVMVKKGGIWVAENGIPGNWEGAEGSKSVDKDKTITSNEVTASIVIGDEETPWWVDDVTLTKSISADSPFSSASPAHLGDTIEYVLTLTNDSEHTLCDVEIYDPLKGSNEDMVVTMGDTVAPGQSLTYSFAYTVQEKDILAGEVINMAFARWYFEGDDSTWNVNSNTVVVPTAPVLAPEEQIVVTKELRNAPANGAYFVEGETAAFQITLRNTSNVEISNLTLYDILRNGEGTVETTLWEASSAGALSAGVERTFAYLYTITQADTQLGFVENTAAFGLMADGDRESRFYSEPVFVPCSSGIQVPGGAEYALGVVISKKETSVPANGAFYTPGETITYQITVLHTGEEGVGNCLVTDTLRDPLTNAPATTEVLDSFVQLIVGEQKTYTYSHMVTEQDANRGAVKNGAAIAFECGDVEYTSTSNVVVSPVGSANDSGYAGLSLVKYVTSAPANGLFYVPGEVVRFAIQLDNQYAQLNSVALNDDLAPAPLASVASLAQGEQHTWSFDYTVTEWDGQTGSIVNVATVSAQDENGNTVTATASAAVPTGLPGGFGVITEMTIVKTETSTPANGSFYTEGETITYDICFRNDGETPFGETILYDALAATDIGYAEHMYPGDERHIGFSHTVTAADVAAGCVYNTAWVVFDSFGYTETRMSNTVLSDTDGMPDIPFEPTAPGKITLPAPDPDSFDGTVCSHQLITAGDTGEETITHICTLHRETREAVAQLVEAANTDAERRIAWRQGTDLWRGEIDKLYEVLLSGADATARIHVMNDRICFYAAAACHETLLHTLSPDAATIVGQQMTDMFLDKCVELCYLVHTAPEQRVDSLAQLSSFGFGKPSGSVCTETSTVTQNGDVQTALTLCEHHATVLAMRNRLLNATGNTEQTWKTVAQLWFIEANTGYNRLFVHLGAENQAAALADYRAFTNSLQAQEMILSALYGQPAVVQEVLARALMTRAAQICMEE